jgi:sugar lactone lactonase YvrE
MSHFQLRRALPVLAGVLIVVGLASAAGLLRPRTVLPPGWQVIRPPLDATALMFERDRVWIGGRNGLTCLAADGSPLPTSIELPPLRQVKALAFDSESRLWVAHADGISCFDSNVWLHDAIPELRGQQALSLRFAREGAMWVGTELGVVRCTQQQRTRFTVADGLASPRVDAIAEDRAGTLWFGDGSPLGGGLTTFDGKTWQKIEASTRLPSVSVAGMCAADDGRLWLAAGVGKTAAVSSYSESQRFSALSPHRLASGKARSVYVDRQGRLWIGHETEGLTILWGERSRIISPHDGLPDWEVKQVAEDAGGNIWIATGGGLLRIERSAADQILGENPS